MSSMSSSYKNDIFLDDNSRKSLNILIDKITRESPTSSKTVSSKNSLLTPLKRKKTIDSSKNRKITEWLSKDTLKESREALRKSADVPGKFKKSGIRKQGKSNSVVDSNKEKTKSKLPRSESFEKYGIVTPSVEEILFEHKKYDEHKKLLESMGDLEDIVYVKLPSFREQFEKKNEPPIELFDCKHLSPDDTKSAFFKNLDYIKDIWSGKIYSDRHERFYNYKPTYKNTLKDLTYSTSLFVFKEDQKLQLVSLMEEEIDQGGTKYYFQVLLPELCLKIFMDQHNMSKKEATDYLDIRPID